MTNPARISPLLNHETTIPGAASRHPFLPEQRGRALCDQTALSLPHLPAIKNPKLLQQQALCPALFPVLSQLGLGGEEEDGSFTCRGAGAACSCSIHGGRAGSSKPRSHASGGQGAAPEAPGAGSAPGAEQLRRAPRAGPSRAPRPWAREGPAAAPRPAGDRAPFPVLPAAGGGVALLPLHAGSCRRGVRREVARARLGGAAPWGSGPVVGRGAGGRCLLPPRWAPCARARVTPSLGCCQGLACAFCLGWRVQIFFIIFFNKRLRSCSSSVILLA